MHSLVHYEKKFNLINLLCLRWTKPKAAIAVAFFGLVHGGDRNEYPAAVVAAVAVAAAAFHEYALTLNRTYV